MLRVLGVLSTAALFSTSHGAPGAAAVIGVPNDVPATKAAAPAIDIAALLTAARGAPPIICGLAAQSLGNGWGWGSDIPAPPLGATARPERGDRGRLEDISDADVTRALDALSSDDAWS